MRMEETVGIGYVTLKKSLIRDEKISKGLLTKDKIQLLPPFDKKFKSLEIIRALNRDAGFYSLVFVDEGPSIFALEKYKLGDICVESSQTSRSSSLAYYDDLGRLTYIDVDTKVPVPSWGNLNGEESSLLVKIDFRQKLPHITISDSRNKPEINVVQGNRAFFGLEQKIRIFSKSLRDKGEYDIQIRKSGDKIEIKIIRPDGLIKLVEVPVKLEKVNTQRLKQGVVAAFVELMNEIQLDKFIDNGRNMMDEDYRLS